MSGSIVITGASSGIGAALALALAGAGRPLVLIGRNQARLAAVSAQCGAAGADVEALILDIRDRKAMADALLAVEERKPVGLVIANAGVTAGSPAPGEREADEDAYRLLDINLTGALNTVLPLVPGLRARRRGRIVFISSIAAFTPLPDAPAYSASKAALLSFGLALRQKLRADGVAVNVVCPGYVTTPMSQSYEGWKPFEVSPEQAVRAILAGIARDRAVIAFPLPLALAARGQALLPDWLNRYAMKAFAFTVRQK
jgi:short-subunit dehydrogenase